MVAESQKVLDHTLNAKELGLPVIFITHSVHHDMTLLDRYTVIHHSKRVETCVKGEVTFEDVTNLITED